MAFQERILLNLIDDDEYLLIKKILASPLGLAKDLITILFENKFEEVQENLDTIKQFIAGVERARNLGENYSLAKLYPNLFSFHQFFQSSYRARQGKSLEILIKSLLRNHNHEFVVPDKLKEKKELLAKIFEKYNSNLDIDVVALKNKKEVLIVQLRSRDDTGGTTAKSSLVEALKYALELKVKKGAKLLYLVSIWDKIKSSQKSITKKKIYSSLKHLLNDGIDERKFIDSIENGLEVRGGIILKMTYGTNELAESLSEWVDSKKISSNSIKKLIDTLINWDDLWLSYSISSLELENLKLKKFNNIEYLNNLLVKTDFKEKDFKKMSYESIIKYSAKITNNLILNWKENSITLDSVADKTHYVRDLILLKIIYEIS